MDDEFAREVLRLAEGQTIEDFENGLESQAQELDIDVTSFYDRPDSNASKPTSSLTSSTQPRRSISTSSQASRSTDITDTSRLSKDHPQSRARPCRGRRSSGTSTSIKDYDSIVSHAKFDYRRTSFNFSSSPVSSSPSTFSLPRAWSRSRESSPRRHIIRGLSRLRLRRTGSGDSVREKDDCPHCPQSGSRHRRILHTLSCGHRYCTLALRKIIKDSLDEGNIPPTCCKRPIPGTLVASVMSQEEQDVLMNMLVAWDDGANVASNTNNITPRSHPGDAPKSRPQSRSSLSGGLSALTFEEKNRNLEKAMALPRFRELRQDQEHQRDNLIAWSRRKRQGIIDGYAVRKLQLLPFFERQKDQLAEKQSATIARIEDKHVVDEHELRKTQDIETRNNAIALKHMEAYCRGETTSGERHDRAITNQDLQELTKARRARDQMDTKHSGAISVLRGEQSRRINQRLLKQEEELAELEKRQLKEIDSLERECDNLVHEWDEEIKKRQSRMERWWDIQLEIWRKGLERETGIYSTEALPSLTWPGDEAPKDLSKRYTIATSPIHEMRSGRPGSISPARKDHRISTAFTISSGMIGKAQG